MGLSITPRTFEGGYGSFHNFRIELAKRLGIPLELMEGFYSEDRHNPFTLLDYKYKDKEALDICSLYRIRKMFPLKWGDFKQMAIHELLYHSDCDGYINYSVTRKMIPELKKVLSQSEDKDSGFYTTLKGFIGGCEYSVKEKVRLEFH